MKWMAKLEYKFGKYAIPNLTLILIGFYVAGYAISLIGQYSPVDITSYLTLNPYAIVHGQVWRLVSWLFIPPSDFSIFFTLIMLFFYYSIGRTLEHTWGDFQYNIYMFSGFIFTILGSFFTLGFVYLFYTDTIQTIASQLSVSMDEAYAVYFQKMSGLFTTYYVNMSIFLAYATTFPNNEVYLAFILPIKCKYLGIFYAVILAFEVLENFFLTSFGFVVVIVVIASMLNFLLFFLVTRNYIRMNHKERKMHRSYARAAKAAGRQERAFHSGVITKHKCAVCGRTEKDGENLVFRFCSKCEGNYEYCQDHLYTHIHFMNVDPTKK